MALCERARNILAPRSTAEGACALRAAGALERDPAVRCPDWMAAGLLGGLNITTLARHRATRGLLVRAADRWRPGAYAYELIRTRFIDEIVLEEAAAGVDELVLLGAGLDSRPYRLTRELSGVRVVEVDHPAGQASKRRRLRGLLDREPANVRFLGIDFTRDHVGEQLLAAGHEMSARTLFVWSGVTPYLPEDAVARVLAWVGEHESPRTSIVFDACSAEAIDGSRDYRGAAELRRSVANRGEPLRWGIPEDRVAETLRPFRLYAQRIVDGEVGCTAYMTRSGGDLHRRPYGGWVLVHARPQLPLRVS